MFNKTNSYKIFVYVIPSLLSIILSISSITIFVKKTGASIYADYIIQHLIMTLAFFLNLNIGKILSIKIQKLNNINKKKVIFTAIIASCLISLFLGLLAYILLLFLPIHLGLAKISWIVFLGLFVSIFYLTFEELCKGLGYHRTCSIVNFLFYSGSMSFPAFFLLNDKFIVYLIHNLFAISLVIKILILIFLIVFFIKKKVLKIFTLQFEILREFHNQSKWMIITLACEYIFNQIDKYMIKISLGAASLIIYTIPQILNF